jgi:hypothetical protein
MKIPKKRPKYPKLTPEKAKADKYALRQLWDGWTAEGLFRELRKLDHADAERKAKKPPLDS